MGGGISDRVDATEHLPITGGDTGLWRDWIVTTLPNEYRVFPGPGGAATAGSQV